MENTPNSIRVVSAIADKKKAIFYLENGDQLTISQEDHRLGDLLDIVIPITARGEVAVISLVDFTVYASFTEKTQGLTKFFRIAKNKVSGWFGGQTDIHETHISEKGKEALIRAVTGQPMTEEHVMEHGVPLTGGMVEDVNPSETVVAVVENSAGEKKVIPGVNSIKPIIDRAVRTNSTTAVENFLKRCADIIDQRQHSVDDLMRFLEKGDLPLAEDGSIIAYKKLKSTSEAGVFVDCHSGKVRQKVGSFVCVNENLVDLNRRNECSNGLHIGRRSYMGGFSGDVCVICKIAPEDVMVVPHNDPSKVRVKGYHIIGRLSPEAYNMVMSNKPMTADNAALKMVFDAIKGNHIARFERVQINGQKGTDVVITPYDAPAQPEIQPVFDEPVDMKSAAALDEDVTAATAINPKDINKRINDEIEANSRDLHPEEEAEIEAAVVEAIPTDSDPKTVDPEYMDGLVKSTESPEDAKRRRDREYRARKKAAKAAEKELIPEPVSKPEPKKKPSKAKAAKPAVPAPEKEILKAAVKESSKTKQFKADPIIPSTPKEQAAELYLLERWDDLYDLKKSKKVGWERLGFGPDEIKEILKHK